MFPKAITDLSRLETREAIKTNNIMAKKISKRKILSAVCSFLEFMGKVIKWMSIGCGAIAFLFIILPLWWMLDILLVLTSPVWYSILIWWSPKKASEVINVREKPDNSNAFEEFCSLVGLSFQNWCNTVVMCKLWTPVVNKLPMRYRYWFISYGKKPLEDYPVDIQLAYWNHTKSWNDFVTPVEILTSAVENCNNVRHYLSDEVIEILWKKDAEARHLWVEGGREIDQEQLNELLKENSSWLKEWVLTHTPSMNKWNLLIEAAEEGSEYALELIKELVEQAIPKPEVLYKIFAKETTVSKTVAEIIDKKADKRATEINQTGRFGAVTSEWEEDRLEKTIQEAGEKEVQRWTNFCKVKKEIDAEAEAKMCAWQYFIFAETGHHLTLPALQRQLYSLEYKSWVKKLMEHEWDNIEHPLILPVIKADADLYKVYIELKVKK